MANSIGKDKRPVNSARLSAASRARTGAGASKPIAPKQTAPVERDVAVADPEEAEEVLDVVPVDDDEELEDDLADKDLVVSRRRNAVRREPVTTRGGFIGFLLRLLFRIPGTRYVAASVQELRKVTAPTPREAWNMTLVVMAFSAFIAIILGAADLALIQGLQWIVGLGTSSGAPH